MTRGEPIGAGGGSRPDHLTGAAQLGENASLAGQDHTGRRVLMFGGKGGVGKTTCSAATALHYASKGKRTLIISSDLTPSLSDIFEMEVGYAEKAVTDAENLFAFEISPEEVMKRWKEKYGDEIYRAASAIVDMPRNEVLDYVAMAPGIQEEFMLDYIMERVRDEKYDVVVWDTAPAGDTLRLLGGPSKFLEHLRMAPKFYLTARGAFDREPFLDIIDSWRTLSEYTVSFLKSNTEFVMVTIPEALGVNQTKRVIRSLKDYGFRIDHLIINNVIRDPSPHCEFLVNRMKSQAAYLKELTDEYRGKMAVLQLPLFPYEIKGVDRLREVERILFA